MRIGILITFVFAAIVLAASSASQAAAQVTIEIAFNPERSILEDASDVRRVNFHDYVSNPRPNRGDPSDGWVDRYPQPFVGLIHPSQDHTTSRPLPPAVGVRIESTQTTIGFFNNTARAPTSNVRANPVRFRFVDPDDPQRAAAVTRVSWMMVGTAVSNREVRFVAYDVEGNQLAEGEVESGHRGREHFAVVELAAKQGRRDVPAIHMVEIKHAGSGYFVVGSGYDRAHHDFAFAGVRVTDHVFSETPKPAEPRHHHQQWVHAEQAEMLTDLSVAQPASALSDRRASGKWKVISYDTEHFRGNALTVGPFSDAETVALPLNREGYHAVYVGLGTIANLHTTRSNLVAVKFTGEQTYRRLANNLNLGTPRRDMLEEVFVDVVDLTDREIKFSFVHDQPALVAYVKLIPLCDEEVEAHHQRDRSEHRRLLGTFDGFTWIHPYMPRNREALASNFTAFANSDFGTWWVQLPGGDIVSYPSEHGTILGEYAQTFPRTVDEVFATSVMHLIEQGVNPVRVAVEEGQKQGAEVLLCLRVQGVSSAPPWEEFFYSEFYDANAQWRTVDHDGTPTTHLSYAVPEVQSHMVAVLREALGETGADGVGLLFHRGMPMILWEDAFVERFQERYRVDPRNLAEDDSRVYAIRATIMTEFIEKLRHMLDEVQIERGNDQRLKLAVTGFGQAQDNEKFGVAIGQWIEGSLIDQVGIAWMAYHTRGLGMGEAGQDIGHYLRLAEGTNVDIYPFLVGWRMNSPDQLLALARQFYDAGAKGIAIWDPKSYQGWREAEGSYWPMLSDLGHIDKVKSGEIGYAVTVIPLTRLGENHYSRWYPNTGW